MSRLVQLFIVVFVFIISFELSAQNNFRNPINYKMKLSGSFGELRTNHFHTGIDIKGSGKWKTNKAIAVMDGYVSRLKISPDGYGNAIYINHPNGITSVYAHLYSFSSKIDSIAKSIQYKNQTFTIYPDSLHIPVKKGEIIGQIGNTGRSFGTHLHFELRNTKTEHPINPFKYGIKPKDTKAPELIKLKLVALDTAYNVLNSKKYKIKKLKNGNYTTLPSKIKFGAWRVGIEVLGYDKMNFANNKNGIYRLSMFVNGEKNYSFSIDSLDFSKQTCLNAHIDYPEFSKNKSKYNRLFVIPGNDLNIYNTNSKNSIIPLYQNKPTSIKIVAKDFDGNATELNFNILRDPQTEETVPQLYNQLLKYGEERIIRNDGYYLKIDKEDLFKDTYLFLSRNNIEDPTKYSDEIRIFINDEVFKKPIDLYISPIIVDSLVDKLCLVQIKKRSIINHGNHIVDGYFHTRIKTGGSFKLILDTIPPTIKPIGYKRKVTRFKKAGFIIKDNFETSGYAKPLSFNGYLDDKWILFTYDKKKNKIVHYFDKNLPKGKHHLKLVVEDDRGNATVYEKDIFR